MSVENGLKRAGVGGVIAAREAPLASRAMVEFEVTTQPRACMFLAQVLHESAGLHYFEEIADGSAYEGRHDLGNVHRGDGRRYKGRGPIQLTGRSNYRWAGGRLNVDLETHPEKAAQHSLGWRIAGLYWISHGLNELADLGRFVDITKKINGGTNGLSQREAYLARLRGVDCRPGTLWAGFTPTERRWITEYDALVKAGRDRARQKALRGVMAQQRKRIWHAAKNDGGWSAVNRATRYRALRERTG